MSDKCQREFYIVESCGFADYVFHVSDSNGDLSFDMEINYSTWIPRVGDKINISELGTRLMPLSGTYIIKSIEEKDCEGNVYYDCIITRDD
jgi:hypothetical protein